MFTFGRGDDADADAEDKDDVDCATTPFSSCKRVNSEQMASLLCSSGAPRMENDMSNTSTKSHFAVVGVRGATAFPGVAVAVMLMAYLFGSCQSSNGRTTDDSISNFGDTVAMERINRNDLSLFACVCVFFRFFQFYMDFMLLCKLQDALLKPIIFMPFDATMWNHA